MFAMLAAFGAEVRTGAPVFVQIQQTPLFIGLAFATIIIASVIPVARKANLDRDGFGPFTQVCCQALLVLIFFCQVMLMPGYLYFDLLLLSVSHYDHLAPGGAKWSARQQLADHLHGWWRRKQRCTTAGSRWLPSRCSLCAPQVFAPIWSFVKLRNVVRRFFCLASSMRNCASYALHVWLVFAGLVGKQGRSA